MKEAYSRNRKKLWLVIALAAALVLAGAVIAMVLTGGQKPADAESGRPLLYWNIDRKAYTENSETGLTMREPQADGLYHFRFVIDGQQVELLSADRKLVNYIDSMDVMGLVLDADGMIVNALDPKEVAVQIASDSFVASVDGDTIEVNSSKAMNGMPLVIQVTDQTMIFNMDTRAESIGARDVCIPMDLVSIYGDAEDSPTHIFIKERSPEADVYLRVDQFYDSTKGVTTREPDENGVYTILFAGNGQQVQLKCKDAEVVSQIDSGSNAKRHLGLLFDQEGYIVACVPAEDALRGKLFCVNYNVTAIEGNAVTVKSLMNGREQGTVRTFRITDETKIYTEDAGCIYDFVGQTMEALEVFDRVICYTDVKDNAVLIYVVKHCVESPMYYSDSRQYDGTGSTRQPDKDGYYVYNMTANGQGYTLKTKDKAIADQIDANIYQMMGLELDGSIITRYYDPSCISGWSQFGQGRYVTEAMGAVYTVTSSSDFTSSANYLVSEDSVIYDVTGDFNVEYGSATTLQKYDRISGFRNVYGQISHAVVIGRYHEGTKIYYNLSRQYDTEKQVTKRQTDGEGYYVYELICEGKTLTAKTKNKTLATMIDKQNAPLIAMKVTSGGIITEAYQAISGIPYSAKAYSYCYVDKINDEGKLEAYYYDEGEKKLSANRYEIAEDCVIYNVSTVFNKYRGEKTTLQADDRIQAFYDRSTKKVTMIFVMERKIASDLYWHVKRCYNSVKQETTREPDQDQWYVFELAVNGTIKTFKTRDKNVANAVDARNTTNAFTLRLDGDVILGVYDGIAARGLYAQPGGFRDVMQMDGLKATLVRNRPGAEDYGQTTELKFAKNCKYYDVSTYAENFGAETKIGLGDRLKVYTNYQGEVVYCFVVNKHVRQEGAVSKCPHCDKEVFWEPYGGTYYQADAHYYLTADMEKKELSIGSSDTSIPRYDIVLDLNGHTLSSMNRNYIVYSTFTILDSVGGGGMTAMGNGNQGGNILAIQGGTVNIYGGSFTSTPGSPDTKNGGILFAATDGTINMYGGTVNGGHVSGNGGCVYVKGGSFNMYGGTIVGGTASGKGQTIYSASADVTIAGGTVMGEYYVDQATNLTLSGTPDVSGKGLVFAGGVTLGKVAFQSGAKVTIGSNGVFTGVLTNAEQIAEFFVPASAYAQIVIEDGKLCCETDFTADLNFADGSAEAECPACAKTVVWTALTAEYNELSKDGHYYLTEDITYAGTRPYLKGATENNEIGTICLHLNGHNITATKALAIEACKSTWNVMGTGTVSGNRSGTTNTEAATIWAVYGAGKVNLYSGTVVKSNENSINPVIVQRNGVVNMYGDAAVESADCAVRVCVSNGGDKPKFYMYGGAVTGTVAADAGTFLLSGGAISGNVTLGSMTVNKSGSDTTQVTCYGVLEMSGGEVAGNVDVTAADTVTLSGAPVISGCMNIAKDAVIKLEGLSDGARIVVFGDGVFARCEDPQRVVAYFQKKADKDTLEIVDQTLVYTAAKPLVTDALTFEGNGKDAFCPVCEKIVVWTAIDQDTYGTSGYGTIQSDGSHLYLAEDIVYSGDDKAFITAPGQINQTTGKTACFHLNGHNITATKQRAIGGSSGVLNVMGTGIVSGNLTDASNVNNGATVDINNNRTMNAINLYSGTYVKAEGNTQKTVVSIRDNGGRVRVYKDATISCAANEYAIRAGICKFTNTEVVVNGTVYGMVYMSGASASYGFASAFFMEGGSISEGVYMGKNNQVSLSGAPVIGGTGMDLSTGAKITLGALVSGTSVRVKANGVFTEADEHAADYVTYFTGVNGTVQLVETENALKIA